ncbi:RWP-RK domain-containing protein [Artemisia annua]|uniref:RWP-RK domain-containing protein n=1 Tax=Artemisia annua TaxID=35608 RepID=A0A2U1NUC9_ARTAN|nr:RWP-RK domain-containing protein [Artemisia annua]
MSFSREIISRYFHMPIHKAAKHLNVGLSVLKMLCRDVGIQRWPYRKLLSLQMLINHFQGQDGGAQRNRNMQEIITQLREEKRQIEENPELPISKNTKRLRQRLFKSNYKKRKTVNLELSLATSLPANVEPLQVIYPNNYSGYEEIDFAYGIDYEEQE